MQSRLTTPLSRADVEALAARLSDDERARARQFVFDDDRRDYIAAHALLWEMLDAHYPEMRGPFLLQRGSNGKPFIPTSAALPYPPSFNLSHARGLVACGVLQTSAAARNVSVGVDVEVIRAFDHQADIAAEYFSPLERESLAQLPMDSPQWLERFFDVWTLREARGKALGLGLSLPPEDDRSAWTFFQTAPTPDTRLAVAVNAPAANIYYARG